jgi:hypothetical protein
MQFDVNEFPKHPLPHTSPPAPNPPQVQPPTVYVYEKQRWEYRVVTRNADEAVGEDELNALGKDGWEMAGVVPLAAKVQFYFKRLRS